MASLRRSHKSLSPDGQTARFLYTILKQLDLKTVDWNEVAGSLDITNGHAARMRFSRFKQCIEGTPAQQRGGRSPNKDNGGGVGKKNPGKGGKSKMKEKKSGLKGVVEEANTKFEREPDKRSDGKIKRELAVRTEKEEGDHSELEEGSGKVEDSNHSGARFNFNEDPFTRSRPTKTAAEARSAFSMVVAAPVTPTNVGNIQSVLPTAPPQATVSLADLQLAPTQPVSAMSAPVDVMEGAMVYNPDMPTPTTTPPALARRTVKAEEIDDGEASAAPQVDEMVAVKEEPVVAMGC